LLGNQDRDFSNHDTRGVSRAGYTPWPHDFAVKQAMPTSRDAANKYYHTLSISMSILRITSNYITESIENKETNSCSTVKFEVGGGRLYIVSRAFKVSFDNAGKDDV
jgi:hypothetical protein